MAHLYFWLLFLIEVIGFICFVCCQQLKQEQTAAFAVYWNIPSEMCHKYGLNFSNLQQYGLIQNRNDKFRGDKISILYDPGFFPAIVNESYRNNGVPQEGNIKKHLLQFEKELDKTIPEKHFSGIGVIDFERWRPIWRENWGTLDVYRKRSVQIEKQRHPLWTKDAVENRAIQRFEKAAFIFIQETLSKAIQLRPQGQWGYYAYPYCFNFTPKNPKKKCISNVLKDNDRSSWMYRTANALFPSIYMNEKQNKKIEMIKGRIDEAKRLAAKAVSREINIFPYLAIKYQDSFSFLLKRDMRDAIATSQQAGSRGLILWGSSKDTNSAKQCEQLLDYVKNILSPIIKKRST